MASRQFAEIHSNGLRVIWLTDHNMCYLMEKHLIFGIQHMVYHKDPFSDRYYSYSISMTFQVYQINYLVCYSPMTPIFF